MESVQGTQRSAVGDLTCHPTDPVGDLPQLAPGPDRSEVSLGIGQPVLPSHTKRARPDECPA
jgi:hypothetical protein